VSSRKPDDIPTFCAHVIAVMAGDRAEREA
jgi:hypothetical protein